MKFQKKLLATLVAVAVSSSVAAQNYGFEDGSTSGWTLGGTTGATSLNNNQITQQGVGAVLISGTVTFNAGDYSAAGNPTKPDGSPNPYYAPAVTAKQWQFSPYGTYMLGLQPGAMANNFDAMTTDLGMTTGENTAIKTMLTTQAQASGFGQGNPTNAAWAYTTVSLIAGTKFKMAWNYIGTDYVPFNDGSITTLASIDGSSTGIKVNNYSAGYALLGFTNPMTGDYSTGTFGSTGWQVSTYEVTTSGNYKLGFASFNLDDMGLSPMLLVDSQQGSTQTCATNGTACTTFGSVAPNNDTAPVATEEAPTTPTDPVTPPGPTLVNNITGTVTSADLDTAPKFNGGTLVMTDGETVSKNITVTNNGGTIDANMGASTISGVISNDGTDTNGTVTIGGLGTVAFSGANTYTGPTVINNGAGLVLLNNQALSGTTSVTNNGGLNITGAGNVGINGSYTQGSNAGLIAKIFPTGATQLNAQGPVSLAGTYTLWAEQGNYAYGKYDLITGNNVSGQFDVFATNLDSYYGNYLKYSADKVQLYITPNAAVTQSSISQVAGDTANALNIQSSSLNGVLGNDCNVFGANGACVSTGVGIVKAAGGDLTSGNLTVAKKINDNWRAGLFLNQQFNNPTYGGVRLDQSGPAVGGFVTWTKDRVEVQASVAGVNNKLNITRNGPEVGTATTTSSGTAYQLKGSYAVPVTEKTTVTPYLGIRYTQLNVDGYTEQGPVFPLTINSTKQTTTDALAGVGVSHKITDKLTGSVSAGVVQNLSYSTGNVSGTSEIANLSTFNTGMPGSSYTSAALGAGMSYEVAKNQRVGVNVGWQQKTLINANVGSVSVNYTIGF